MDDLVRVVAERQITSIAIPALGCGNGGLDWQVVRPLIEQACVRMPQVRAVIFPPAGVPSAASSALVDGGDGGLSGATRDTRVGYPPPARRPHHRVTM